MVLNINGRDYTIPEEYQNRTLLFVLREYLAMMGTKRGCATNDCGACRVLVDGKAVNSCAQVVRNLRGKKILTIEGLAEKGRPHPIQQAFVDAGAVQCGFCTPGMIISAKALLDQNSNPSEAEIRAALDQNLCRCTGYVKIVEAIQLAAQRMREA